VDNLPAELPRDASTGFSAALWPLLKNMTAADFRLPFSRCALPLELQRAAIVYNGELTPSFQYLNRYLQKEA
jgi:hypothetical protein